MRLIHLDQISSHTISGATYGKGNQISIKTTREGLDLLVRPAGPIVPMPPELNRPVRIGPPIDNSRRNNANNNSRRN